MNRLKSLRVRAGLTLRDLDNKVGIRIATLSAIENGKQPFREIHVQKLTSFFDVTSDYLLGYDSKGIGIYFDDDHAYISESEMAHIAERYEIKETLLHQSASNWRIITPLEETRIIRCEYSVFRSVDIPKENAHIEESVKEEIINELNKLDTRELEKVLKFINDYIK